MSAKQGAQPHRNVLNWPVHVTVSPEFGRVGTQTLSGQWRIATRLPMRDNVYKRLQSVFEAVFGPQVPRVSASTTARDIKRWDSLTHLNLVIAIEEEFSTTFTPEDVRSFGNVGDVATALRLRLEQGLAS